MIFIGVLGLYVYGQKYLIYESSITSTGDSVEHCVQAEKIKENIGKRMGKVLDRPEGIQDFVKEKDEDNYLEVLRKYAYTEHYYDAMKYQIEQPCSFLVHSTDSLHGFESDLCQYHNIVESDLLVVDEKGNKWNGTWKAYIADEVLDKYIREYGGEDTLYHIAETRMYVTGVLLYGVYCFELYNEDTRLFVIWNDYIDSVVTVLIGNC